MRSLQLKHVNNLLFAATIFVLLYIITAPLLPAALFWVQSHTGDRMQKLSARLNVPAGSVPASTTGNRLVVPSMLLDTPINEGTDLRALRSGTWRRPNGSAPDKGGNTIIVGHRFTYTNPRGTFYFLNKVKVGDQIGVFWNGKRYLYKAASISVVPPTDVAVEAPTKNAQLTLYTCTPLWLPKDRLVIVANLEGHS
ncbi:MAG TPA: class E sortase [Candidatus Saccharimonadales bacterium]